MAKVWKGLFYCFWHSDKAPVQEDLATQLAGILPQLSPEVAHSYFNTFLVTMQREWFGIDRLRLDKFLMLVRKFLQQLYVQLHASSWDKKMLATHITSLHETLKKSDDLPAAGLSFHLADISVPELLTVLEQGEKKKIPERALRQLLDMYAEVLARSTRASFLPRLREGVFDPVLEELQSPSSSNPFRSLDAVSFSEHIFALGADPTVKARNREVLYELSSAMEKAGGKKRRAQSIPSAVEELAEDSPRSLKKKAKRAAVQQPAAGENVGQATDAPNIRQKVKKSKSNIAKRALAEAAAGAAESPRNGQQAAAVRTNRQGDKQQSFQDALVQPAPGLAALPKIKTRLANGNGIAAAEDGTPKGSKAGNALTEGGTPKGSKAAPCPADESNGGQSADVLGASPKARKKVKKAKGLGTEAVTRAAERTLAAISAHKRGDTTVRPATPGSPSEVSFDAWFDESLASQASARSPSTSSSPATVGSPKQRRAGSVASTPSPTANGSVAKAAAARPLSRFAKESARQPAGSVGTPQAAEVTPGGTVKRVKFALKRNISLFKGQPVPPENIRTPTQLKPRGSALKKVSSIRSPRSPRSVPPKPSQMPSTANSTPKQRQKQPKRMFGTI